MKAKIKKTGEIVDVYHETQHGTQEMIYKESVLVNSRMWTEDELELLTNNDEHWQDVRERAAIAAMQGLAANSCLVYNSGEEKIDFIKRAIRYADTLVKELKNT